MNKCIKDILFYVSIFLFSFALIYISSAYYLRIFYPVNYYENIKNQASKYNLSPELVLAVVRTESNFKKDVVSSAGAVGLMQIMPKTFNWLQKKKSGTIELTEDSLYTPDINIEYGCYYLRLLLQHYKNDEILAICAYNAGIGTVDTWIKNKDKITIQGENISLPYGETSQYVKNILISKKIYESIYNI